MGRKTKYTPEQKIKACEDYLNGKKSASEIAQELGMTKNGDDKIRLWAKHYKAHGAEIFKHKPVNTSYSKEFKLKVVKEYLTGGSIELLCVKYSIPSVETLRQWIKKYNNHIELKDYDPKPEIYMAKSRKTTQLEREEIVKWCLDHNKNYKEAALTFKCSYAQVFSWVNKYEKDGLDGLKDKRGKRKEEANLTELEKLQKENELLKRKLELSKRREELLKKADKLERM